MVHLEVFINNTRSLSLPSRSLQIAVIRRYLNVLIRLYNACRAQRASNELDYVSYHFAKATVILDLSAALTTSANCRNNNNYFAQLFKIFHYIDSYPHRQYI